MTTTADKLAAALREADITLSDIAGSSGADAELAQAACVASDKIRYVLAAYDTEQVTPEICITQDEAARLIGAVNGVLDILSAPTLAYHLRPLTSALAKSMEDGNE